MKRIPLERRLSMIIAGRHASGEKYWAMLAAMDIKRLIANNYRRRKKV